MSHQVSPFLDPGSQTSNGSLAIVQLSKDNLQPIYLKEAITATDGYAEGFVLNTRFGSFPHSTLLNVPWGAQVRASAVDTGSRGRKRKRDQNEEPKDGDDGLLNGGKVKEAVAASSGFVHILPPTPELWTMSLPHRTQVVYTPDYSYILHRIRARPGTRLIEAGAGSGSFSHASARAVFNGPPSGKHNKKGKVYSYEFNESRYHKMKQEIIDHRLSDVIQLTHRDVYNDGFLVDGESPEADAVFLDLPSPWEAIPHLARSKPHEVMEQNGESGHRWVSPLNPSKTTYICTFSPCIEQVTRTIEALRKHGWVEIDMVEVNHKRINVLRERLGVTAPQEKGTSQSPRDVMDAIARLKEVEARAREFQNGRKQGNNTPQPMDIDDDDDGDDDVEDDDLEKSNARLWLQGRLIHRTESEIKTHTSYLTFAVLPREWSAEQEAAAMARWPCGSENKVIGSLGREERKEEKRKLLLGKKGLKAAAKLAAKQAQNDVPIKKETAENI